MYPYRHVVAELHTYRTTEMHKAAERARFNGFELPSYGSAIWNLGAGDFGYIRNRVTDVQYSN
jgi:hypothetical protein